MYTANWESDRAGRYKKKKKKSWTDLEFTKQSLWIGSEEVSSTVMENKS